MSKETQNNTPVSVEPLVARDLLRRAKTVLQLVDKDKGSTICTGGLISDISTYLAAPVAAQAQLVDRSTEMQRNLVDESPNLQSQQQPVSGAGGLPEGVAQYTKKPVTISAIRWTGGNLKEVIAFTGMHPRFHEWFSCWDEYVEHVGMSGGIFKIFTLEGVMEAAPGDWIIRGVKGEHYPCKPDIFDATYDAAQPQPSGNSGELESFSAWANDYCEMHQHTPGNFSSKITQFAFMAWQARAALAQQDADKVDAERYRAWRDAACKNDRTLIDAMFEYQQMHFKDGTPTPEQFNAGIDYALAAIDAARKEPDQ